MGAAAPSVRESPPLFERSYKPHHPLAYGRHILLALSTSAVTVGLSYRRGLPTTKVRAKLFEAPLVRSSMPRPEIDLGKNQNRIPTSNLMAQVCNKFIFSNRSKPGIPTSLGWGAPSFENKFQRICATFMVVCVSSPNKRLFE